MLKWSIGVTVVLIRNLYFIFSLWSRFLSLRMGDGKQFIFGKMSGWEILHLTSPFHMYIEWLALIISQFSLWLVLVWHRYLGIFSYNLNDRETCELTSLPSRIEYFSSSPNVCDKWFGSFIHLVSLHVNHFFTKSLISRVCHLFTKNWKLFVAS